MQPYFEINLGFKTDVGRIRKNNEDYIKYFIPTDEKELKQNGCLFIVADGVGGAAKGEVASHFAGDTVIFEYYSSAELPPAERLAKAMQNASREIYDHSQKNGNFTRMATTMVAALILQNNLIVAHVGDSRLYLIREGKIKQITRDHSVVAEMVRNGAMTEEEARTSKAKNRLSRSIGGEAEVHVDVSAPIPLNLGDRILLCSDGLTRYLDGEDLKEAALKGDVETVTKDLVKFANEQGGIDNVSVIILEIVEKAKIRIKKPLVSKTPPEKLGWDEAETEYPGPSSRQKKKIPVWVMIGGAMIIVGIIVFGIVSIMQGTQKKENTLVISTKTLVISETSTPTETLQPTNTVTPTIGPSATMGADVGSQGATVIPSENWECIFHVGDPGTTFDILDKFNINRVTDKIGEDPNLSNYYQHYSDCTVEEENNIVCSGNPETYPSSSTIGASDWFVVYLSKKNDDFGFFDRKYCKDNNGFVFEVP